MLKLAGIKYFTAVLNIVPVQDDWLKQFLYLPCTGRRYFNKGRWKNTWFLPNTGGIFPGWLFLERTGYYAGTLILFPRNTDI